MAELAATLDTNGDKTIAFREFVRDRLSVFAFFFVLMYAPVRICLDNYVCLSVRTYMNVCLCIRVRVCIGACNLSCMHVVVLARML